MLRREPKLDRGSYELARAYALLSTERSSGMSLGPIRIRAVWEWLDRAGIRSPILRRHVENVFNAIDSLTLRRANRPQSSSTPDLKNDGLPVPNRRRRKVGGRGD